MGICMEQYVITISRQFGSMGRSIAKELSENLGIEFLDRDIVEATAKRMGLPVSVISDEEESMKSTFFRRQYPLGMGMSSLKDEIFYTQKNIIRDFAAKGSCIIVGRCADYALEENPNVLSIFIKADMQDRIRRIAKLYDLSDAKAKDKITKIDKQRASYYNYYTSKRWGEVDSYDLCLNSSVFGIDGTVDMIKQAIEVKEAGIRKIFSI